MMFQEIPMIFNEVSTIVLCFDQAEDFSGLYSHLETTDVRGSAKDISGFQVGIKSTKVWGLVKTNSL